MFTSDIIIYVENTKKSTPPKKCLQLSEDPFGTKQNGGAFPSLSARPWPDRSPQTASSDVLKQTMSSNFTKLTLP